MYVVTRVRDGSDARGRYFVQVLDTRTGQLVAKVEAIADTLNGRDDCNGQGVPSFAFDATSWSIARKQQALRRHSPRTPEKISTIEYHGHVLGFDVSDPANPTNLRRSFCATPNPE